MPDEFIPLAIPNITEAEGANLQKCIETTFAKNGSPNYQGLISSLTAR